MMIWVMFFVKYCIVKVPDVHQLDMLPTDLTSAPPGIPRELPRDWEESAQQLQQVQARYVQAQGDASG